MSTAPALFPGTSPDVLGMDSVGALSLLASEQRREDEAAARKLAAVAHWADLFRADDDGAVDEWFRAGAERALDGMERDLKLGGAGVFYVEEFSVAEVATTLGVSETAARKLVGEALELRERLPRCWAKIMAGDLQAWKGRQIAAETLPLNAAAAAYVDAHLAPFASRMSWGRILRAVQAAVIRHDKVLAAERAAKAAESRGVWRIDDEDGITTLTVVADTPDATAFDNTLDGVAAALGVLGDDRPVQVRRAKAIGILADPQAALILLNDEDASSPAGDVVQRGPVFHIHLHHTAVAPARATGPGAGEGRSEGHAVRVTGFGAVSLEVVQRWLAELGATATVKVTPVVDLNDHVSVDAYEVPDRLRNQVAERDHGGCRFPWCNRQGGFDVDHIDPYVPPDDGGPPGQTHTANTARLCRFHHRVKTFGGWICTRTGPAELIWTSPHGRCYTVDEHGTSRA